MVVEKSIMMMMMKVSPQIVGKFVIMVVLVVATHLYAGFVDGLAKKRKSS